MNEELKPCPFCGGDGEMTAGGFGERQIRCANKHCDAGLGGSCWQTTEADAISAWNRRTPDAFKQGLLRAAEIAHKRWVDGSWPLYAQDVEKAIRAEAEKEGK